MISVYPVILTAAKIGDRSGYAVYVPDLEINTQGHDLAEAIAMARDAIGMKGICEQDEGRAIAPPSHEEPLHGADDLVTWVDIDFDKYRRAHDMKTVRINVTVPQYLKDRGDECGVNFSQTLQKALKEELKAKVAALSPQSRPGLAVVLAGFDWVASRSVELLIELVQS